MASELGRSPQPLYVLRGLDSPVHALHFLGTDRLLTGTENGTIVLWNLRSLRPLVTKEAAHTKSILCLNSAGPGRFWSQGRDDQARLWSVSDAEITELRSVLLVTVGFCRCSSLSVGGKWRLIGAGDSGGEINVVDCDSGAVAQQLKVTGQAPCGMCMAIQCWESDTGSLRILAAYEDGHIRLWDAASSRVLSSLRTHEEAIFCCKLDSRRKRGVTGAAQKSLVTFSLNDDVLTLGKAADVPSSGVTDVAIRGDDKLLSASLADGRLMVLSWKSLKRLAVMSHHQQSVHCLVFSAGPERFVLAAGSKDTQVSLWSVYNQPES